MARTPSKIPHLRAKPTKSGKTWYYYRTTTGESIPLGCNKAEAMRQWMEYENRGVSRDDERFQVVSARYRKEALVKLAPKSQREYGYILDRLDVTFHSIELRRIDPKHIREYLDKRTKRAAANAEIRILSAMFNWARERGITSASNPCAGVKKNRLKARDIYVTDGMFYAVYAHASPELQIAMDIAYHTGQRPTDVRKMRRSTHIHSGCIWVVQGKTGTKMGIRIEGRLKDVIDRAGEDWLVSDKGRPLSSDMLEERFNAARAKVPGATWEFRDIRPKAATDLDDLHHAKELLGHSSETVTAAIYRRRRGNIVSPTK